MQSMASYHPVQGINHAYLQKLLIVIAKYFLMFIQYISPLQTHERMFM